MNVRSSSGLLIAASLLLSGCGGGGGGSAPANSTAGFSANYIALPPIANTVTTPSGDQIVGGQFCVTFKPTPPSEDEQIALNLAAKYQLGKVVYQGPSDQGPSDDYYLYTIPDQRSPVDLVQQVESDSTVEHAGVEPASLPASLASVSTAGYSIAAANASSPTITDLTLPSGDVIAGNEILISFYRAATTAVQQQIMLAIAAKYKLGTLVYPTADQAYVFTIPDGGNPQTLVQQINLDPTVDNATVEGVTNPGPTPALSK